MESAFLKHLYTKGKQIFMMMTRFILLISLFIILAYSCVPSGEKDHKTNDQTASTDSIALVNTAFPDTFAEPEPAMPENKNQDPDLPPSAFKKYPIMDVSQPRIKLDADTTLQKEVSLTVMQDDLYAEDLQDTVRVRMYNYSKDTLMTGLHYRVEMLNKSTWEPVKVPPRIATADIGYELSPNHAMDFLIRLYPDFHAYKPGKYRVTKSFHIRESTRPYQSYQVIADFEIL